MTTITTSADYAGGILHKLLTFKGIESYTDRVMSPSNSAPLSFQIISNQRTCALTVATPSAEERRCERFSHARERCICRFSIRLSCSKDNSTTPRNIEFVSTVPEGKTFSPRVPTSSVPSSAMRLSKIRVNLLQLRTWSKPSRLVSHV